MRIAGWMSGIAVLGTFWAGTIWAQETSDVPSDPESDAVAPCSCGGCGDSCCEDVGCCETGCCDSCSVFRRWQARDPWKLPQPCVLQRMGITTGGWLQAGITANGEDPGDGFNGPVLMNDRHGDLQMHQFWLYFERACDTGGYGVDIGGRVDLFYGTDWRAALCHGLGLEDRINGQDQLYGFAVPQFYVEAALNDLSVKMGRMAGILGYEMIPPMGNFFYSHSYTICYTEPLLITGLMARYELADQWAVLAGLHQGIHRFEDNNNELNFQGGLTWTSLDKGTSLAYAVDAGKNDDAGLQDEYVHSLVFKRQLTERALYAIQNNLGFLNGVAGGDDAEWYSIVQYLVYALNPLWSAGVRVEWFRDDDGVKILGMGNLPGARGWLGAPGYAGSFTDLSLGLNWKPKANLLIRPEVRWDWYDGPPNPNGPYPLPFDNGSSSDQLTFATDLVVTF